MKIEQLFIEVEMYSESPNGSKNVFDTPPTVPVIV